MLKVIEPEFDVIVSAAGRVMVVLSPKANSPSRPFLVHNGWRTFALFRDENEIIMLENIPRRARKAIRAQPEIVVAEMSGHQQERAYNVKVIYDSHLKRKLRRETRRPIF